MTYQDRLAFAERVIAEHNLTVEESQKLNWQNIKAALVKIGATSLDALSQCSWEDLQECGIPRLIARNIATEFRTKPAGTSFVSDRMAERMGPEELLARYSPDEVNAVSVKLKALGKNSKFIVFTPEDAIDVPASLKLLQEIQKGFGQREVYVGNDGRARQIYAIGDKPNNLVDVNPLYAGRVLRPDGTCDQTNRSWEGISTEIRTLLFLAIQTGEVQVTNRDKAHDLMDMAVNDKAEEKIRKRYPKASIKFDELKSRNELPSLKVQHKRPTTTDFIGGDNRSY
jgi:hypothetical protein